MTSKPIVFLIDDDQALNKLLEARFHKMGCEIKTFTLMKDFLRELRKSTPQLLLIDLNLEEGFVGIDLIRTIREDLKLSTPILILSSEEQSQVIAHAIEIGANDFLPKPPLKLEFEDKIAEYIQSDSIGIPFKNELKSVDPSHQQIEIRFSLSIASVHPLGFELLSSHLVRKGSPIWLSGKELTKILPSFESLRVTVTHSQIVAKDHTRLYLLKTQVDSDNEKALEEIKNHLS